MILDKSGRLLFFEPPESGHQVLATPGLSIDPTPLVSREPVTTIKSLAINQSGHIYAAEVSEVDSAFATIRVYDSDGQILNDSFAEVGRRAEEMAFGPGGVTWGTDLYVVEEIGHQLLRLDSSGHATVIGTGFRGNTTQSIAFGPDAPCTFLIMKTA